MQKNSDNFSMQDAIRLAQTDAGRQLLSLLQSQNGETLQKASTQASNGDYGKLKQTMAELLSNPQAKALLEQLRRQSNG